MINDIDERAARRERVFGFLRAHDIDYEVYYHPEAPTIEIARRYWRREEPLFPQPQGQPPLSRSVRLRARACHTRSGAPPASGQAVVRLGAAHGPVSWSASGVGFALRTYKRCGEPRTPVSGPHAA